MDEAKAAEYYDEMRRKGGGAAKLKQGLGYGASSSPPSSQARFPSFVKGDSHEESFAKLEKEDRLAAVRDKLKQRPSKNEGSDVDTRGNRKHSPPSQSRDRGNKRVARGHSRSRSRDREHLSKSGTRQRREHRSGSNSSSEADRAHHRRTSNGRSSSESPTQERVSYRSERKKQDGSSRARRRSRSPRRSSRRPRSVSPTHYHQHPRRDLGRESHHRRSPSLLVERQKSESKKEDVRKSNALDYAKHIPGYDEMTQAEKVREKMKLQLSDTVSKDKARGINADWERFTFNRNAPLDDDAKLDYFGDGTGARDDTGFLQNTGSTFLSTTIGQAKREAQIQAAHDAAIFGPSTGMSSEKIASCITEFNGSPLKEERSDNETAAQSGASSKNSLLSDQVLTFQQGSWRERALKLKQQKACNTLT